MGSCITAYRQTELPENFFRVEVIILRYLGIELIKQETLLYKIYSRLILLFLVYFFTFTETLELYSHWGDLNEVVNVISYLFTHVKGLIKVTLLFHNRKKIGNIIKILHEKPFAPNMERGGIKERQYVRRIVKITETQLVVYFLVVSIAVLSGAFNFIKLRIMNDKELWRHPYIQMTIIDTSKSPLFELAGVYEIICVSLYATLIATTYVLLSTILAHLSVQFDILINAFKMMRERAKEMNTVEDGNENKEGRILDLLLREYVDHHLKVYELAKEMEQLCFLMFLVVFLASVVLLCFLLFQVSMVPMGSTPFFLFFFYYWIIICQIGMYCYWGNEVTLKAVEVSSAAAQVDWPGAPIHVSKALIVIIARSQKPLFITAGKFVPLSMHTFMSIVKGSFSYFMVLRQTQEIIN